MPLRGAIHASAYVLDRGSMQATLAQFFRMAGDEGGLLYLPTRCVEAAVTADALQGILQTWMPRPSEGVVPYYPSSRPNPAALRCLADFLHENLHREMSVIGPPPGSRLLCA